MSVRQFAHNSRVSTTVPDCLMNDLHNKCVNGQALTAGEKQQIFDNTREYKGLYKMGGWEWNFREYMKRFIVCIYESQWETRFAFSKSNIKKNSYTNSGLGECYEIPNPHAIQK